MRNLYQVNSVMKVKSLASDPVGADESGLIYFNTTSNKMRIFDGTSWGDVTIGSNVGNFKADGSVTATGNWNLGGFKIGSLADPTLAQDAATKKYVDDSITAISIPVTSVFGRTGAITAQSGDYNTSIVAEGSNLYFTNSRAIAATLTGYASGAGTISAADSILSAIQKLNGNIAAVDLSPYFKADGSVTATGNWNLGGFKISSLAAPIAAQDATNKNYVDDADALKAPLASPALTGVPTAPTASANNNTTQIATTAYVDSADALKSNIASPTFTGVPAAPTAAPLTSTTQIATTAFVTSAVAAASPTGFIKADGTVAMAANLNLGTNKIINVVDPTAAQDASTKNYVDTGLALKSNIASPTFTGVPAAPTAAPLTSTTQIATTAYVDSAVTAAAPVGFIKADGTVAMTANFNAGTNKIINVVNPTSAQDAATKSYVDAVAQGLSVKSSVKAATIAALPSVTPAGSGVGKTLTASSNGLLSIDGVSTWIDVAANSGSTNPTDAIGSRASRVLVKNQAAAADNGIYIVQDKGSAGTPFILTRALDADGNPSGEVDNGMFMFVREGSINANTGWSLITAAPITVDTTGLAFTQFSGAGAIVAGAGLLAAGNVFNVQATDNSMTISADDIAVKRDAAGAVGLSASGIAVNVDASTIEISANALRIKDSAITNAKVAAGAAIAYSKLALSNSIVNADINASAAIVESKLALDFSTSSLNSAIALKANTASPTFTGVPAAPTAATTTNTTQIATTAFVQQEITAIAAGANRTLSNLTSPTSFNQDLLPSADVARDIGSSSLKIKDLWASSIKNGSLVINAATGAISDTAGIASINSGTRILSNSSGNDSIDYQNRRLKDGTFIGMTWSSIGIDLYDSVNASARNIAGVNNIQFNTGASQNFLISSNRTAALAAAGTSTVNLGSSRFYKITYRAQRSSGGNDSKTGTLMIAKESTSSNTNASINDVSAATQISMDNLSFSIDGSGNLLVTNNTAFTLDLRYALVQL